MTETERFKIAHEYRKGQLPIHDRFHKGSDDMFPQNLSLEETVILLNQLWNQVWRVDTSNISKLNDLGMIDNIITKTDLSSHEDCISAIKRIDEITNGYGDSV